jgi:murein DD-endopeptidase MepM/ murein hydrolase activator NlpD
MKRDPHDIIVGSIEDLDDDPEPVIPPPPVQPKYVGFLVAVAIVLFAVAPVLKGTSAARIPIIGPKWFEQQPSPKRIQLHGGKTPLPDNSEATKDPKFRTPLPVEYPKAAAHLPARVELRLPWHGEQKVIDGYGYYNQSWTHQTISNAASANDFFALDIGMTTGTPVLAAASGRIITSMYRTDSYGRYVVIDHGHGIRTIYAHLSVLRFGNIDHGIPLVEARAGEEIGLSGMSGTYGPHLHFAAHLDSHLSHSGCDVAGLAVCPEPLGRYYGIRPGQTLVAD